MLSLQCPIPFLTWNSVASIYVHTCLWPQMLFSPNAHQKYLALLSPGCIAQGSIYHCVYVSSFHLKVSVKIPSLFFCGFFFSVHLQLSSVLTDAIRPDLLGSSIHLALVVWKPVCLIILLGRVNQNNWGILSIWVKSPCWALCCCSWISSAWKAFSTLIQAPEIATERHRTCKAVTCTCLLPNDRITFLFFSQAFSWCTSDLYTCSLPLISYKQF